MQEIVAKSYRKSFGFTLIELLVAIAIVGVLSAVVLVSINPGQKLGQARNSKRKADLSQIAQALADYLAVNSSYPTTSGVWCGAPGSSFDYTLNASCGNNWAPNLVSSGELKYLPQDSRVLQSNTSNGAASCASATNNTYLYRSDGTDYKLLAYCTPEGIVSASDPFNDPNRSGYTYAIWSSSASQNW